jgi:nitroimidazol reductase NimA-like FMN-containing flavoprotein (pyridoxamine 5'-phosphate oxidase superfamily)
VSSEKRKGPLDESQIRAVLAEAEVGYLATLEADGRPYVTPLNFVEMDSKLYFHGPAAGRKIGNIKADPRVGFSAAVLEPPRHGPTPCDTTALFRSVICEGRASLAEDRDLAVRVLAAFSRKYAPQHESPAFEEGRLARTFIIEVIVSTWTGKFHR